MAQPAANLSSQLHTGKVPIPSPGDWNESEIQLKAALTSQQCGAAWSSIPCVTDASAENTVANAALPADVKKIENCHAAIALLIASFSQNKQLTLVIKRSRTTEWPGGRPWDTFTDSSENSSVSTRPVDNNV